MERRRSIAKRWTGLGACAILVAIGCGSHSRSPDETPSAPSARPPVRALPVPPPNADAGPPVPDVPRAVSLDAFGVGERIADLAGLAVGDRILLAWVTYFDEGSAALRKKKPARAAAAPPQNASKQGATVAVRLLDKDAEALAQPKVLSTKGVSIGGVALATASGPKAAPNDTTADIALAWVGKDGGLGQVFVTKLSDAGDKQVQKMITHAKVGCSDVAIAAIAEGYALAWVESKDERAEIVAVKVGKDLGRIGAERRVASTKGEASDVRLVSRGDELLVLWSESRASSEGEGGIGAARLLTADLATRGDPSIVLVAPRHARGLDAARAADGVEVAWIEDAPESPADAGAPARALFLAKLDASARSPTGRVVVPLAADPTSVVLDCNQKCRAVVSVAEQGELALYGFAYGASQRPGAPRRIANMAGVSTEDTSPVLVKDWLFFAEDDLRGGGRLRKAKLAW